MVPLFHFGESCLIKKTAVLIDAGHLRMYLPMTGGFTERANIIEAFALACVSKAETEEMHRVLYYDCPPYDGKGQRKKPHPLDPTREPTTEPYRNFNNAVLTILKAKPYFAVRLGEMSFDGWALSDKATSQILSQGRSLVPDDFEPVLHQKGVDLRIGLDVALMAKDRLIDRIVVVSGDADIVPAMKVARREGVQVVLTALTQTIKPSLREHADLYRHIDIQAVINGLYPTGIPAKPYKAVPKSATP